jgi:hypothetical protein
VKDLDLFRPRRVNPERPIDHNRATGRTTDIVNKAISKLLKEGRAVLKDHWCESEHTWTHAGSKYIRDVMLRRLSYEHNINYREELNVRYEDGGTWIITIKNFNQIKK